MKSIRSSLYYFFVADLLVSENAAYSGRCKSHYSLYELELFCFLIDLRPQTHFFFRTFRRTIMSTRTKPQNLVNKNEINCKASRPIDSFKCKNCDDEFASSRSYDSHRQHRNGVAGEPPAGASLTSSLREEAR